jgi:hypothetical protein
VVTVRELVRRVLSRNRGTRIAGGRRSAVSTAPYARRPRLFPGWCRIIQTSACCQCWGSARFGTSSTFPLRPDSATRAGGPLLSDLRSVVEPSWPPSFGPPG